VSALFVVDPLSTVDPEIDSNVGLMAAVDQLGEEVWVCEPQDLALVGGRLRARGRRIALRARVRLGDHRWSVPRPWFDELERRLLDVAHEVAVVLLRLDPPVDPRYLRTTYLLDAAADAGVLVVNRPAGVLAVQEKLFALRHPDLCPPTIVTADPGEVLEFVEARGVTVLKPVDGFAGMDVWLLRPADPNLTSLIESATRGGRHVVAQAFLPAVAEGNKRIFLLDGDIIGAVDRVPSSRDFRIGPPVAAAAVSSRDEQIAARLAPDLARHGIVLAGLDVIDGRLIEVNVTCPGGMHKTDALLGTDLSGAIMRRLLHPTHERLLA
jgi:glutathione synthase